MTKRDYYEVLNVSRSASSEEIKRAYRKLAVQHHPDKNAGDPASEVKFKELGEAYEVLMDEEKRAAYDRYGHQAVQGGAGAGGFHDPFDLFREVFGNSGGAGGIFSHFFGSSGGGGEADHCRGSDLRYDLVISLEESATGCEKEIEISKLTRCTTCEGSGAQQDSKPTQCPMCRGHGQVITSRGFFQVAQTCPTCQGLGSVIKNPCPTCRSSGRTEQTSRIKIKIPAGIDQGTRLRSVHNGEAGIRGGAVGDLYIVIHIEEHTFFERDGNDLRCTIPISFTTAALGGEVSVPTLNGTVHLKIPAGTQGGSLFRLKHQGIPDLHHPSHKGDLFVEVHVEVPTELNAEQHQKLEEFAALCGEHNTPIHKTFYEKLKHFFQGGHA